MRCSIKSFYPYILEKARFVSVWCTVKMIFPTSQMPSQSKFSQINHITRTNQIMLSNTIILCVRHFNFKCLITPIQLFLQGTLCIDMQVDIYEQLVWLFYMVSTRNELGNLHYSVTARVLSIRSFGFLVLKIFWQIVCTFR